MYNLAALTPYLNFFESINWRLIFISLLMIGFLGVIIYTGYVVISSIKYRLRQISVTLPDISEIDRPESTVPQFVSNGGLEVELIDPEDDGYDNGADSDDFDEEFFSKTLARESGQRYEAKEVDVELPKIETTLEGRE